MPTKPLSPAELDAIKARLDVRTYSIDVTDFPTIHIEGDWQTVAEFAHSATFIGFAPADIAALLDEVERLNSLIASEGLHPACMAIADTNANLASEVGRLRGAIDYAISTTDEWTDIDSLHELNRNLRTVLRGIAGETNKEESHQH